MTIRINVGLDRVSALLVLVTRSLDLMGARGLPPATARSVAQLARATRAALEAAEYELASTILDEIVASLGDEESRFSAPVLRHVADVRSAIERQRAFEARS